jgi:hypothetical protein
MVNHFAHEGKEIDTNRIICSGFYRCTLPDVHLTITAPTPAVCVKQRYSQLWIILRTDFFLDLQCRCLHLLWPSVEGYCKANHASCLYNRSDTCEIARFHRSVIEDFPLLGYYARRRFGSWLPAFRDSLLVLSSKVKQSRTNTSNINPKLSLCVNR